MITNSKIYGVPLYGSSWLPINLTNSQHDDHDHDPTKSQHDNDLTKSQDDQDHHDHGNDLTKSQDDQDQHDHDNDLTKSDHDQANDLSKSQHDHGHDDNDLTKSQHEHDKDAVNESPDHEHGGNAADESPPSKKPTRHVVLAGGGGEGRIGIPNALLILQFDANSNSLSDHPVAELSTGDDLPYRMAIHPKGEGLVCSMPKSCRWFEWEAIERDGVQGWCPKSSEKILKELEDVGQQLALTFDEDGSLLAVGGEDGYLRVFKWPSMDNILDEANAHASVKDLAFSPDGKFLASVGSDGPGRVWDMSSSVPIASLKTVKDEQFVFCKFSMSLENHLVLYVTAMQGKGGSIVKWNTKSWKRERSKRITRESITAFSVSADGKYLAAGTMEGDILVLSTCNMRVHTAIRKAHLGILTSLMFSHDSRALLSTSFDSSARVTVIDDKKINDAGWSFYIIMFILLLAIAVYYATFVEFLVLLEEV